MIDPLDLMNLFFLTSGGTIALLGIIAARTALRSDYFRRVFYTSYFSVLFICLFFNTFQYISLRWGGPEYTTWSEICRYNHLIAISMLSPILTVLLLKTSGKNVRGNKAFMVITALTVIHFIIISSTWFTPEVYYHTPDNSYHRGPYFFLLMIPVYMIMAINFYTYIRNYRSYLKRERLAYLIYLITPAICIAIHIVFIDIEIIALGRAVSSLTAFTFVLQEHIRYVIKQEHRIDDQNASILALQMRPHFIYNTLTSIYYLVEENPKEAQHTILEFTSYLRKNFTAIVSEEPIAFTDELEHAKAYLAVEQVRFNNNLTVTYDIGVTDFKLPPLTLQPLVENAVKHCVHSAESPLVIFISTDRDQHNIILKVENSNAVSGFTDNDDPHIALDNIRNRLMSMCGGTLDLRLSPPPDDKATVTITLPC